MTDALDAVIDAALERALLDADDARRYFALAGALSRGGSTAPADGAGAPRPEGGTRDRDRRTAPPSPGDVLGAALLSTAAAGALGSVGRRDLDPGAWSPDDRNDRSHADLVAVGAAAAYRRFDVELDTVAARSGLPPERLARIRSDGDRAPESR